MDPVLQLINLEKTYDNFKLDKISFKLERGYIMGFIGPNGAGKTTTIKLILDVIKPDGGQVLLFGEPSTNAIDIKERIGFVFGDNAFYEFLSAKEMAEINQHIKENKILPKTATYSVLEKDDNEMIDTHIIFGI